MHSVLFVARIGEVDAWQKFVSFVLPKVRQAKGVMRLGENVWLVNLRENVTVLGYLIAYAEERQIPYGILPFEHEPQWLPAGLNPSTTLVRSEPR
jgi:hypothetical protein